MTIYLRIRSLPYFIFIIIKNFEKSEIEKINY